MTVSHSPNRLFEPILSILRLAFMLGWNDVRQAYRRSALGPFWMTISMAVQVLTMGVVFSLIFKIELRDYLPWLTCSTLLWSFFSASINEASGSFYSAENIIRQIPISPTVFTTRVIWKNIVTLGHNAVILPFVFLVFSPGVSWVSLLFIPGFLLAVGNLFWIGTLAGMLCARYRDMAPIISSFLVIAYYFTPILWKPSTLGDSDLAHWMLGLNPLYHIFQSMRQPLLGDFPTVENWAGSILVLVVGAVGTIPIYHKFKKQIPYWV